MLQIDSGHELCELVKIELLDIIRPGHFGQDLVPVTVHMGQVGAQVLHA